MNNNLIEKFELVYETKRHHEYVDILVEWERKKEANDRNSTSL